MPPPAGPGRCPTWPPGCAEEHGVVITPGWLAERLKAKRFRWKRTQSSLRHKQADPDLQASKRADLEVLTA